MFKTVLLATGFLAQASAANVRCDVRSFDRASADILLYGDGPWAPNNTALLNAKCASEKKSLLYAEYYVNHCVVGGVRKSVMKIFVETMGKEVNKICTPGALKDDFIRFVLCLNEKAGPGIFNCNKDLAATLESIADEPKRTRVGLSCCHMRSYIDCFMKQASKCGRKTTAFMREILSEVTEEVLETFCYSYKSNSEQCRSLQRVTPETSPKYMSIFPALSDALGSS